MNIFEPVLGTGESIHRDVYVPPVLGILGVPWNRLGSAAVTTRSGHPLKFPAVIALSHIDLTGYPHTACIHFIFCSVDGKLYTLFAFSSAC